MRRYLCFVLILLSGCATSFQGEAHFPGGRASCQQKCGLQGLSMVGFVYMGEYSSACLCEVPGGGDKSAGLSSGATGGAAAAVMTQMQNAQAATTISSMLIIGSMTGVGVGAGG